MVSGRGDARRPVSSGMRIDHLAVWTRDLDRLRDFYQRYFEGRAGGRYDSARQAGFSSYFVVFPGGEGRLEIMTLPTLGAPPSQPVPGYAHVAIGVGSRGAVDRLTARMAADGVPIVSPPRETGDGYYEAVVKDPDGN